MNFRSRSKTLAPAAASFVVPFAAYVATAAGQPGFDDSAEFVYCASEWTTAHPPGFAAYVAFGHLWTRMFWFVEAVRALEWFSGAAMSGAVVFVFLTGRRLLAHVVESPAADAAAWLSAMSFAFGMTAWQWGNAVEVYALQVLAVTAVGYAATFDPRTSARPHWLAGIAIGIGLGNHNMTMALFVPAALLTVSGLHRASGYRILRDRRIGYACLAGGVVYVVLQLAMVLRASGDHRFEFHDPSTLRRWWHFATGGFFGTEFFDTSVDVGGRARVYAELTIRQFGLFLIPAAYGAWLAWRKSPWLAGGVLGFGAALLVLQLPRTHVASMDATMLPAFAIAAPLVALGAGRWMRHRAALLVSLAALVVHAGWNFNASDRRGYDVGDSLMADLDTSAPKNSIVVITNWEQRMIYELYRDRRDFREDLIVVHSSLKGTNARCLSLVYPKFHNSIRTEFDEFLAALAEIDPYYPFTDYFDITTRRQAEAYAALVGKLVEVARSERRPLLMDRETARFWVKFGYVRGQNVHGYGNLLSLGRLPDPPAFGIRGRWLDHPFLEHDFGAQNMLANYEISARQMMGYYRSMRMPEQAEAAAAAALRLAAAQKRWARGKPANAGAAVSRKR